MMEEILSVIFVILLSIVSIFLSDYLNILRKDKKCNLIYELVKSVVYAVEQTSDGKGVVKKGQALEYIFDYLNKYNIACDTNMIDNFIESAVFEMNNMEVTNYE